MGLFQRQTEACFKKHRVINKPNYSKFRSTTDDTQEETKRSRGLQRSTLTVCPHHLKPKHLVRCAHPLQNDSILWLQNLRRNRVQEAVPTGFGQVRSTHNQQQEQNSIIIFPKDCDRQVYTLSGKNTNPQSLQTWLGFIVFGSRGNFLDNTPRLKTGVGGGR